jgi:hypothetical protein
MGGNQEEFTMHVVPKADGNTHHPIPSNLYLYCPAPEARRQALCHIYLKVLATLTESRDTCWVAIDPPCVALIHRLEVLSVDSEAPEVWASLLTRQWIESSVSTSDTRVRLTSVGRDKVAASPAPLLQKVPRWYNIMLEYLYKATFSTPPKTDPLAQTGSETGLTGSTP